MFLKNYQTLFKCLSILFIPVKCFFLSALFTVALLVCVCVYCLVLVFIFISLAEWY